MITTNRNNSSLKIGRMIIYFLLIVISISAIFSVGLEYQTTHSDATRIHLITNSYFYLPVNFEANDTVLISFQTQNKEDLSFSIQQNQIPVFSVTNSILTNGTYIIPQTGQYTLEFHNAGNETTIYFTMYLERSGITTNISRNYTFPKGDSYMLNELITIFRLFVLLTICPLIVFVIEGRFTQDTTRTDFYNDIQTRLFWKTPFAQKFWFPFLLITPLFYSFFVILIEMNSKYVGITGILLLFSISNILGSIRYLNMTDNNNLRKAMYIYNGIIIGLNAFLYLFFIELGFFEQFFKPVLDFIGLSGLQTNYNGWESMFLLFLLTLPLVLTLFLLGLYQYLFTQRNYFDFKNAKIIKKMNVFFIPITIAQEISFDDILSGEIKYSPLGDKKNIVASLFNTKWNRSFQLINEKEKKVYNVVYQLLCYRDIPIQNNISSNYEPVNNTILTKKMIEYKYPEFQNERMG